MSTLSLTRLLAAAASTLVVLRPAAPIAARPAADLQTAAAAPLSVDFLAVGADGQPVLDLKPADVAIRIDGKVRPVRSLRLVAVGDPGSADAVGALPPPFGSNDAAEVGRSLLIVIDDESIAAGSEQDAKASLTRLVDALSPRDRVGLVTVPHGGEAIGLTRDHGRVRQALSGLVGRGSRSEDGADAACRSRLTLQALAALMSRTRSDEGPLTVLFLSSSLISGRGAEAPTADIPNAGLMSRRCELTPDEFRKVAVEAAGAHAFFYVIQPEVIGGSGTVNEPTTIAGAIPRWSSNPRAGLESLAGVTGGQLLYLHGATGETLALVLRETSAVYVATIEPDANERNNAPHQLSVKVARPGVAARTRPDVIIPRPLNAGLAPPRAPASAHDLLLEGTTRRELPLRGIGYASRAANGDVAVLAVLDPVQAVTLASAAIGMYDARGTLVNQWVARDTDLARKRLAAALVVAPGTYRLRVAAMDTAGRAGTADYEVAAELAAAGPLKLSDLVLGLARPDSFEPRLAFTTEPVAVTYLEVYGRPPGAGARITLAFELASTLNGPALVTVPGVIAATSDADKFVVNAAIPIGSLAAGDYVVRAIIGLEDQPAGRVYRTFRKE